MNSRRGVLLALLLVAPLLAGCVAGNGGDAGGPEVVATAYPGAYLAQRLGGSNLTVETLVTAGQEPHAWSPTVGDVRRVAQAELLVAQGAGMEPWLDDLLSRLGDDAPPVVVTTEGLDLLAGGHHGHEGEEEREDADHGDHDGHAGERAHPDGQEDPDPHTWLDPVRYASQGAAVEQAMVQAFPEHAPAIQQRGQALQAELADLHDRFNATLQDCRVPFIIVSHNAFAYLGERYGFEVESLYGRSPESEGGPQHFRELVRMGREHNVSLVFREDLADPRPMQRLADEIGAALAPLHPLGGLTAQQTAADQDYASLMDANRLRLQTALACP